MSVRTSQGIRSRLAALSVGILVSLWIVTVPGAVSAAGIIVQSSPASPVGVAWTPGAEAVLSLQATDTDPLPTEILPGEPPQTCQGSNPSWNWSAQITSGPSGPMTSMNPASGPSTSQLTVSEFPGPGSWQVEVTATVTYQMTPCSGTVQRTGTITVTVTVVAVSISADGQYVGCGLDQAPINLTANPMPSNLTGASYSWTVAAGPGSGTFGSPSQQKTTFVGSTEGNATLQATMTYQSASTSATQPVTVVRLDVLTASVTPQLMNEIFIDADTVSTIPFTDPTYGNLTSVLIAPPDDSALPYVWQLDYTGYVDHQTGNVSLTFLSPAPYLLQINRNLNGVLNTQFQMMWVGGAAPGDGGVQVPEGEYVANPNPPATGADLICISAAAYPTNDNGFDKASQKKLPLAVPPPDKTPNVVYVLRVNQDPKLNLQYVINAINLKWNNNGNKPFKMTIIGHGAAGRIETGGGTAAFGPGVKLVENKELNASEAGMANSPTGKFITACNGKVTDLYLYGCQVALNDPKGLNGDQFLQTLATGGNMNVSGWNVVVASWPPRSRDAQQVGSTWGVLKGGNLVTKKP